MTSEVSPKVKLRWESIQFLCLSLFVPQVRGSLNYARDDVFFVVISTSPNHAVISTKCNAWRNPLMRSCTYPPLSFYPHKLQRLCFLISRLTFSITPLSHILTYPYFPKALSNSAIQPSVFSPTSQLSLLIVFILFLFIYRCYNMLYLMILLIFLVHFFRTTG